MEAEITTEQELRQALDKIRDRLAELAQLSKAAYQRGDILLALTYAREGESRAAMGYEYAHRLHDLLEPAGEYPEAIEAAQDMLDD